MSDGAPEVCAFCGQGEEKPGDLRKTSDDTILAHYNCLIFSPQVALEPLENSQDYVPVFHIPSVRKEIARGKRLRCSYCKKSGATIGCDIKQCRRTYHYPCVIQAKGEFVREKYIVYCLKHANEKSRTQNGQINNPNEPCRALDHSSRKPKNIPREKRKRINKLCSKERKKRKTNCGIVENTEMGNDLRSKHRNSELPGPSTSTFTAHQDAPIMIESNSDSDDDLPIFNGSQILQMKKEIKTDESFVQMSTEEFEATVHTPHELAPSSISELHNPPPPKKPLLCLDILEEKGKCKKKRNNLELGSALMNTSTEEQINHFSDEGEEGSLIISVSSQDDLDERQSADALDMDMDEYSINGQSVAENASNGSWSKTLASSSSPPPFIETEETHSASPINAPTETHILEHAVYSNLIMRSPSEEHNYSNKRKANNVKNVIIQLISASAEQLTSVQPVDSNNNIDYTERVNDQSMEKSRVKDNPATQTVCPTLLTEAQPDFIDKINVGLELIGSPNSNAKSVSNPIEKDNQNSRHSFEPPSISDVSLNTISTKNKVYHIDIKIGDQDKVHQNPKEPLDNQLLDLSNIVKSSDKKELHKQPTLSATEDGSVGTSSTTAHSLAAQPLDVSVLLPKTTKTVNEQFVFSSRIEEESSEQPSSCLIVSKALNGQTENCQMSSTASAKQPMNVLDISSTLNAQNKDLPVSSKTFDEQSKNSSNIEKTKQPTRFTHFMRSRKSVARALDFSDVNATKDQCIAYSPLTATETSLTGQSSHTSVVTEMLEDGTFRFTNPKDAFTVMETLLEGTSSLCDKRSTVSSRSSEDKGVKASTAEKDLVAPTIHQKGYPCKFAEQIPLNNDQKIQLLKSYSKTEKDISHCNNMGTGSARAFWDLCFKYQCQHFLLTLVKCSLESVIQKIVCEEAEGRDYEKAFMFLLASGCFQDFLKEEGIQKKKSSKISKLAYRNQHHLIKMQSRRLNEQEELYRNENPLTMETPSPEIFSSSAHSRNDAMLPENCSVLNKLQDIQTQQQSMLNFFLQHCLQQQQHDQDGDAAFATSLIPFLRKVPEDKKLATHIALEERLLSTLGQNLEQQQTLSAPSCHNSSHT